MTKESISNKLSELFELHKSGALTKDEYDRLKRQILSEGGIDNVETQKKQEQEPINTLDNPIRVNKRSRIWILGVIGIGIIFIALIVVKTSVLSYKSDNVYKVGDTRVNSKLLPEAGLYEFYDDKGYKDFIRVLVIKGEMTFQRGENVNTLENIKIFHIDESGNISLAEMGDDIQLNVANGGIDEHFYSATLENTYTYTKVVSGGGMPQ